MSPWTRPLVVVRRYAGLVVGVVAAVIVLNFVPTWHTAKVSRPSGSGAIPVATTTSTVP